MSNPELYHQAAIRVPPSVNANTFHVCNYLEFYLVHENTTFSNDSKMRFYFDLIQPSYCEDGYQQDPVFVDELGQPVGQVAREGEVIQGAPV